MSSAYAFGQLNKALGTAASHGDGEVRERAARRAADWAKTLHGMANGTINVGSRVPVKGLPAWVTLSVQAGGFASGGAIAEDAEDNDAEWCYDTDSYNTFSDSDDALDTDDAPDSDDAIDADDAPDDDDSAPDDHDDDNDAPNDEGDAPDDDGDKSSRNGSEASWEYCHVPHNQDEAELVKQLGIPEGPERRTRLFAYYLSDEGLESMYALLDSGEYEVRIPEDAALLTVAWLIRAGDTDGAVRILDEIQPFSHRFRFAPRRQAQTLAGQTSLITVGEARKALRKRRGARVIEKQRKTLQVWNPFADRLLELWYPCIADGVVTPGGEEWMAEASHLVREFAELKNTHIRCRKVIRKSSNIAWLVDAAAAAAKDDGPLTPLLAGRVRTAVAQMIAKRGRPGSDALAALRERQNRVAKIPSSKQLVNIAAERLTQARQDTGLTNPAEYGGPTTAEEAAAFDVPVNTPMPPFVHRVLKRTLMAPVDDLEVPSATVYATFVPMLASRLMPATYVDKTLARLMARNYEAFSKRRSLLLLDLAHQVRVTELPWVIATKRHQNPTTSDDTGTALEAIKHLGAVALQRWPGTILPNKLVSQMNNFVWLNGLDPRNVPLLEELAADIFCCQFSNKFTCAAKIASKTSGTLYLNYYGIDAEAMQQIRTAVDPNENEAKKAEFRNRQKVNSSSRTFLDVCQQRAGATNRRNEGYGRVIEQAQILTTHNLAVLVSLGLSLDWPELALRAWRRCVHLLRQACRQPHPLCNVKNAAYAWRQALFFISIADPAAVPTFIEHLDKDREALPELARVVDGFKDIVSGGSFNDDGESANGKQFTGWVFGSHWILRGAHKPLRMHSFRPFRE